VDDAADACLFLMQRYNEPGIINIGVGEDLTIRTLAELVKRVVGFTGDIRWDADKPDGTPRKLLDINLIRKYGWQAKISLEEGLRQTYQWFREHFPD
jgi:GDP-L-fucose synthase